MGVNLNTVSVEELKGIQGLGEEKARQLVNYREKNGPFESWEDLSDIPGFSDGLIEALKKAGAEIA
ncbi:MAG: hypothetical protein A3I92_02050 [Candidatus Yanofskybacteria bacterium RIFCSPLOWO2_02_FULL_43_10b]|uniref:Helix-hairpin-helix DNA-binding motif class 1 domain-containing protein n=1 Tax=Candidatus Yanofskybacteria bacterium RIFCSPLOWO2_02_FULL_43_10b TaxID=1802704 RepID=A0A1F8GYA5_9BACT|nr:MAG: hypothetical protein A3I92_02050 [Candidatus Yanofskybacteria bacterium RIFCSPLOWO2_02_FULL_43_10b]